ncbi:hypothetical protein H257_14262 [Aphanomyces astaci]|uniref:Uncharacterized protein n=1 Tax=Aphanomyces astaci TaxID=112090 RepID=W4FTT1_APHAT|nr:hypothetical protein H257_14262 [Aphanomyces astaci]ETV70234.1 hypothetical protein H257_14262 [Aphanomyces astaci]|eukprot:XP_009840330.1 hypothetical protein H257_14262 [Aphanomyces astaci]
MDKTLSNIMELPDQTPDVLDLCLQRKRGRRKEICRQKNPRLQRCANLAVWRDTSPEFGLLDSERLLRKKLLAAGLVPMQDDDGARVSTPGQKRETDGSPDVSPPTDRPETRSPFRRPILVSAADLALVPTTPLARTGTNGPTLTLARTGTDGRDADAETLERYSIPVPAPGFTSLVVEGYRATITVATGGIQDIQKAYEEFTWGIKEQQRTASLLFFQQANEDRASLLGVQESQLVEVAEGFLRATKTHESRGHDEFQKALTYLRDCYTRELDVAWVQVTNEANEVLHREAEKNALSWEDQTRELERQLALKWEQREALLVRDKDPDLLVLEVRRREDHLRHDGLLCSLRKELRTHKRNHQEEILLVREATRDEDISRACGEDPSPWTREQLERERHANKEVLRQDLTLSHTYEEVERQRAQLQVE